MPYKVSEIILFLLFHYSPGRHLKNRESSCRNDIQKAHFRFSQTCLKNSRDIPLALETSYRERYSRNLTLSRLNEAIILPLVPDKGDSLHYDPNMSRLHLHGQRPEAPAEDPEIVPGASRRLQSDAIIRRMPP